MSPSGSCFSEVDARVSAVDVCLWGYGGWWERQLPCNKEGVSQFKITTKRSTGRELYRKTSIRFREMSNYEIASKLRGIVKGVAYM